MCGGQTGLDFVYIKLHKNETRVDLNMGVHMNEGQVKTTTPEPIIYEFRIQGHISDRVAQWFEGMRITPHPDGTTTIYGPLPDQTALHSILARIRDMNIKLISVNPVLGNVDGDHELAKGGEI